MKTLPLLAIALLLILPAARAQTSTDISGGDTAVTGQPRPGPSFMWEGKLRSNCHVVAVTDTSVTISTSNSGAFVIGWDHVPDDVRKQLQPEYDAIVKKAAGN